jgi:hypothetical protein
MITDADLPTFQNKYNNHKKYPGSNSAGTKLQTISIRWQNKTEHNLTAVSNVCELLLNV